MAASFIYHSPIGPLTLLAENGKLTRCDITDSDTLTVQEENPADREVVVSCAEILDRYFATGEIDHGAVPLAPAPTPFAESIRRTLLTVPSGQCVSYSQLAVMAGHPATVSRAVARVMAINPLLIFVPCHRVIRSDGSQGGFRAGLPAKQFLQQLEKSHK